MMKDLKEQNSGCELLAPAGDLQAALVAFDSGADAVYAGMQQFNARERTENFQNETLARLVLYAHQLKKKVYIAFNTLIKESEIEEVVKALKFLNDIKPDAVIVQDLGVVSLIKTLFPELVVHASTQMGIHNSAGVNVAHSLGIERVILERQVYFSEIEQIAKKSPIELEVFVHGALCCSLSGSCLFSSWQGGWSGNRGKCKQPCRRRFFQKDGNGFFFSPKDLYTLEHVKKLVKMGISSFKIEGRLRKSDYVRNVVTAYRMMLDAPEGDEAKVLKQAKNVLSGSLGRKWSAGFTSEKAAKELINYEALGANGQLCGKITSCQENGFTVSTIRPLHVGDSIRIQASSGEEGVGLTITRMRHNHKIVKSVGRNSECFIFCDKEVAPKGRVFKISGPEGKKLKVTLPKLDERKQVDLNVEFCEHYINVTCENIHKPIVWRKNIQTQVADKHPIDVEKLETLFKATNSDVYRLGKFSATIDGNYFVPASQLKQLKTEFWSWLAEEIEPSYIQDVTSKRVKTFLKEYNKKHLKPNSVRSKIAYILTPQNDKINKKGTICKPIYQFNKKSDEVLLPYFVMEGKLERLTKEIKRAYDSGIRRFRVTSLFHFELLKIYSDIVITTSYPFPVTNSFAVETVSKLGATSAQAWLELEYTAITELVDKSTLPIEVYRYGRPVILSTRAEIPVEGDIADARSNGFTVVVDKSLELTLLLPEAVLSIPDVPNTTTLFDLSHAYWGEEKRSRFNFDRELV